MTARQYMVLKAIYNRYRKIVYPYDTEFLDDVDFKVYLAAWHCSRMQTLYPWLFDKQSFKNKFYRGRKKVRGHKSRDRFTERYNEIKEREKSEQGVINLRVPIFLYG